MLSWILFDSESILVAFSKYKNMFGFGGLELVNSETLYYITSYGCVFSIAIIGALPIIKNLVIKIKEK